jgi:hypothetical protein
MIQSTMTPTIFEEVNPIARPDESRFAADDRLYVEFFREPMMHPAQSREAGRAIYQERDFVRIHVPGDKSTVCVEPMHEINLIRFRSRYDKWKAGQAEAVTGTPLHAMPGMTPAKVEEYKFFKIITIEQLADANDQLGQKFMSFQGDKQRAKAFIEATRGNAPIEQMNAELQKRDSEIENLKTMVEALQAQSKNRKAAQAEL